MNQNDLLAVIVISIAVIILGVIWLAWQIFTDRRSPP